jgi:hypothetical protein
MKYIKSISYLYSYNYFGKDKYNGKIINGSGLDILFKIYKGTTFVNVTKDKSYHGFYICDVLKVSFDKKHLHILNRDSIMYIYFCDYFKADKIDFEIVGYNLSYVENENDFMSYEMEVSEYDYKCFLMNHLDDFDIPDNRSAQVLAYSIVDIP